MVFRREVPGPHRVESPPSPSFLGNFLRTILTGPRGGCGCLEAGPRPCHLPPSAPRRRLPSSIISHLLRAFAVTREMWRSQSAIL